ncbi:hypothetical protein [Limibacterium fermenti]|uniref:hypothetical protein n=1 Tax=Limibacterium fermenti TaxID=3229863 RepID=UPI003A5D6FD4
MTNKLKQIRKTLLRFAFIPLKGIIGGFVLLSFSACNSDVEDYYDTLNELPQIDLRAEYDYTGRYLPGDELTLYGRFQQPRQPLTITIGGVEAGIIRKEKEQNRQTILENDSVDKITLLVAEAMGFGKDRPVVITSGQYSISGPGIEILNPGASLEPYAFEGTLALVDYTALPSGAITWVEGKNGTGNLYYYRASDKTFYSVKDGATAPLLSLDRMKETFGNSFDIRNLQAAAIDPAEETLYFTGRTNTSYELIQYTPATDELKVLNKKPTPALSLKAPYANGEALGTLELAFSRLQCDEQGGLYVWITGASNQGVAYIDAAHTVQYRYTLNGNTLLPAPLAGDSYFDTVLLSPQDGFFYVSDNSKQTIARYDLQSPKIVESFASATASENPLGLLNGFFGTITLPVLSYDHLRVGKDAFVYFRNKGGVSELYVTDLAYERVVPYAAGFDTGSHSATSFAANARLINSDAEGQLYFAVGQQLVKTTLKPE